MSESLCDYCKRWVESVPRIYETDYGGDMEWICAECLRTEELAAYTSHSEDEDGFWPV